MKRSFAFVTCFAFVLCLALPVFAADLPKPVDKLTKGTIEIVKSPLEIVDHSKKELDASKYKFVGLFKGIVISPFHMVKKAGDGAVKVATFAID